MNLREHDRPGMAVRWILWLLTMAGWGALIYGAALVIGHDADREWEIRQHWIERETGRETP
jgi:hypothetical protein